MAQERVSRITRLLEQLREGHVSARAELVTLAYPELRQIAAHYLRRERADHTLRVTGLVNEVYVRLFGVTALPWQNRAHFFAAVAREARHVLVDYARARNALKRPEGRVQISLSDIDPAVPDRSEDVLALDEALTRLENEDARAAKVVELRYFTGLTEREAAEVLGISVATLKRDWSFAKAWLFGRLSRNPPQLPSS